MNHLLDIFALWSAPATAALFSAIWQGAVLAALVAFGLRLFPGLTPAARSAVWLNVFVVLALLHLLPAALHPDASPHAHAVSLDPRWSIAIAAIWLALSAWRAAQLTLGVLHLHNLSRRAVPVTELEPGLQALLSKAPTSRAATLCTSAEVARPSVLGFTHPRVLLPPALLEKLSPEELRQVVLHEMEHLRRADDWTNLLQKIALVLFPLNPALLWVERRLCAERELACDDRVMSSGSGRKAYAVCLTRLAEFSMLHRGFSLVLGAWERRPELVRRVHRILAAPARTMSRKPALAVTSGMIAGALACGFGLAHSPQLIGFSTGTQLAETRPIAPLDLNQIGRELGGTPHMVNAMMPQPRQTQTLQPAVARRVLHHRAAPDRMAAIQTRPAQNRQALLVLTEWTDDNSASRLVISVFQDQRNPGQRNQDQGNPAQRDRAQLRSPSVVIPAMYAVPTPNGWLILQI